jgi:phosphatidylserine/phosphatidylglycerophosphate/cardiolipin synthase-like enzyme
LLKTAKQPYIPPPTQPGARIVHFLLCLTLMCGGLGPGLTRPANAATCPSLQVCFSPGGGCTEDIVNAIRGAQHRILVQAYEMTSPRIKSALVAARRRGVEVKAIFDPDALKEKGSMVAELAAGGIQVMVDNFHQPGLAHNKVMIIDGATVITGSFNFTRAAESRNAENLLVIQDPELAGVYQRNFNVHLAHSSALGAAQIPPPRNYHRRHYYRAYRWRNYW